MSEELSLKEMQQAWHGSFQSYLIGFLVSLTLTSLSFLLVIGDIFSSYTVIITIAALAIIQAAIQLKYFMHLGKEGKPYWESFIFAFMILILMIITCGSLWVMHDLNQRTMTHHKEKARHD